jgi:hypothetical protein
MKNAKAILITLMLAAGFVTILAFATGSGVDLPAAVATKSDTGQSQAGAATTQTPEGNSCDPNTSAECAPDNPACSGCSGCSCSENFSSD